MSPAAFWALIGSLTTASVALFGIYVGSALDSFTSGLPKSNMNLTFVKSSPVIDSVVRLISGQVNPGGYRPFQYVVTSIHNYGDLPARNLQGNCRIYSPAIAITQYDIPIRRDALGPSPYEFAEFQLVGVRVDEIIQHGGEISIHVDIEFDYFGISEDQPKHYSAHHRYDPHSKQMVKI